MKIKFIDSACWRSLDGSVQAVFDQVVYTSILVLFRLFTPCIREELRITVEAR